MFETSRLIIREFELKDASGLFELNSHPEVLKYTGDPPFESIDQARAFVKGYDQYEKYGYGRWALVLRSNQKFIGWCGLKFHPDTAETDIGFRINHDHWDRGYATEAGRACIEYGFEKLHLKSIIGRVMRENTASVRVIEKLGMGSPVEFVFDEHPGLKYHISKSEYETNSR
jgi:ribosomal-protein-alanine N-acetyltransferase